MTALPSYLVDLRPSDWQEVLSRVATDPDLVRADDFLLQMLKVASDVGRCQRKGDTQGRDTAFVALGHLIFAGASRSTVFLSTGMALKFPGRCTRCGETGPCGCGDSYLRETTATPTDPDPKHVQMSICAWQADLRMRFHAKNVVRGFEATLGRFNEEVGEAVEAQRKVAKAQRLLQAVSRELLDSLYCEYADILAWWIAVVNLCDLQAEDLLHLALTSP